MQSELIVGDERGESGSQSVGELSIKRRQDRDFGAHVSDAVDGFADGFADFGGDGASGRREGGEREGGPIGEWIVDVVSEIDGNRGGELGGKREGENGVDGVFEIVEIGNVALLLAAEVLEVSEHVDGGENGSSVCETARKKKEKNICLRSSRTR